LKRAAGCGAQAGAFGGCAGASASCAGAVLLRSPSPRVRRPGCGAGRAAGR
jgi:hypothetical protein